MFCENRNHTAYFEIATVLCAAAGKEFLVVICFERDSGVHNTILSLSLDPELEPCVSSILSW